MISAFEKPLRSFTSETVWLCEEFALCDKNPNIMQGRLAAEMTMIRLHDAWARFCRELIILSAAGNIVTMGGMKLKPCLPAIKKRSDVVAELLKLYKKKDRRNEPFWYSASECISAGQRLGIKNLPTIRDALGASNSPAQHLRDVRNFYAHRKKHTAIMVRKTGAFSGSHSPQVFQLKAYTRGGLTVVESWKFSLIAIATAAIQ